MKKRIIITLALSLNIQGEEAPTIAETYDSVPIPENIRTLHLHNSNIVENNNMPKIMVNIWNTTAATVTTILTKAHETACSNVLYISDVITNNKKLVGFGTLITTYAATWLYIQQLQQTVVSTENWSSWKIHIPLNALLSSPQQEVAKELVIDIQKKYTSTDQLTDFISPLVQFMNTIHQEKNSLERYVFLQKWLYRCYLHKLLPHDEAAIFKAYEKIDRLVYLKQLLISWISEYKIQTAGTKQMEEDEDIACEYIE